MSCRPIINPLSELLISNLITKGFNFFMNFADQSCCMELDVLDPSLVSHPCWMVDFNLKREQGGYENFTSGYSTDLNEAIFFAYQNVLTKLEDETELKNVGTISEAVPADSWLNPYINEINNK